jgi:cation diffusion facilitator CzcD-associated flavoprotein CzcO
MADIDNTALIVGAGPAGLSAAAALKKHGVGFELHERHSGVGGLWDIDNPGSPMYRSAHFISSKYLSHLVDLKMPAEYPDYPSNRQLLAYIRSFARQNALEDRITFNSEVVRAEQIAGGWRVTFGNGEEKAYRWLLTAVGTNWHPHVAEFEGTFNGRLIHSRDYHSADELTGKRVLVVGAGNSGCDIACDAARSAGKTLISMRRGYHFIPKHVFGMPADVFAAQPPHLPAWLAQRVFTLILRVLLGDLTKLGLPKPDHRLLETHPLLNDQLIHHLRHGDIAVKGDIQRFEGDDVVFKDGSRETVDVVILATGYQWLLPFLDKTVLTWEGNRPALKLCFAAPNDPSLFCLGFLETNGGIFKYFTDIADLVARSIKAELTAPDEFRKFRNIVDGWDRDLSGGIRFLKTPRHAHYVNSDDYRAALKSVRKQMGWPALS